MQGPHNSRYEFIIAVGDSFTVTRERIASQVTRTETTFVVKDSPTA